MASRSLIVRPNRAILLSIAATMAGAGVAPAAAQAAAWLILDAPDVVGPGSGSFEVGLRVGYSPGRDRLFAGVELDVHASEAGWSDPMRIAPGGTGPGTTPGTVVGPDVLGVIVGQLHFPPGGIYADPSNPIAVWRATFTVSDFTPRTISIETDTIQFALYGGDPPPRLRPTEAAIEIQVIPAPGLAAMALGAGMVAGRRRRGAGCQGGARSAENRFLSGVSRCDAT
jgi:hypothetical protein